MCATSQRRVGKKDNFDRIMQQLANSAAATTFSDAHDLFHRTFRDVEMETEGAYSQERGQSKHHLYFYPYSPASPFWMTSGSLRILEGNSHYAIFDQNGNFAVYARNNDTFLNIIISADTDGQVSDLSGQRKRDL